MIKKVKELVSRSTEPRTKAGERAEKQMAHYLERAFGHSKKVWVFHDLRFELGEGDAVQIDHLILYQYGIILIESKSVTTEVRINQSKEWDRKFRGWKGMPSPVQQAKRQVDALRKLLNDNAGDLLGKMMMGTLQKGFTHFSIRSLVAISDQGRISGPGRQEIESQIHKADQICDEVKAIMKQRKKEESLIGPLVSSIHSDIGNLSEKEQTAIGNFFLERHTPRGSAPPDQQSAAEMKIEETAVVPQPPPTVQDPGEPCPRCDSTLVLRTAKKGPNQGNQFYGCSRYPKCRFTKNFQSVHPEGLTSDE